MAPINERQYNWGYKHCFEHIGRRLKNGNVTCMECGHEFTYSGVTCNCPSCSYELKIMNTRKRVFDDYQYYCIVTRCKEFQVLRFFYMSYFARIGNKTKYFHSEVLQRWIDPSGKTTTVAKPRNTSFYVTNWTFWRNMEIKKESYLYNITPIQIYPIQLFIPQIKRTGFSKDYLENTPYDMLHYLLTQSGGETLLKAKQLPLLRHFIYNKGSFIKTYWPSIRICLRNKYFIKDPIMWCDYIYLLNYFKMDLRNKKFVCPADIKAEHDKLVARRNKILERERLEQQRLWEIESRQRELEKKRKDKANIRRKQRAYVKCKAKFLDVSFTDGEIQVTVLKSVAEFYKEGKELDHCVFANNYYEKEDSLILSAHIGDKRIETIEISLAELKILQCQGYNNENSEYHDRIVNLVNKNIKQIYKRISA